jgi:hypothetical protein
MTPGRSDNEIDALLAEGRFSGPTKDRVFEGALAEAGLERPAAPRSARAPWKRRLGVTAALTAAAGLAALVVIPRFTTHDDPFRAKGAGAGLEVDVTCAGGATASLSACPSGSTLVFSIEGDAPQGGFLEGYAEALPAGARIWYFSADGDAPAVPAHTAAGTLAFSKAIRVGPEHAPGEYRLALFVTRVPLTKAELISGTRAADIIAAREAKVRIVATGTP